jgi:superoxide dismutase, Fe-Mn family
MKTIIELPNLPYADTALEPFISKNTFSFHHGKHHKAYVDKANSLLPGSHFAETPIEEIVKQTCGKPELGAIFNNVAQAWNHSFYWKCMKPNGGGLPSGKLGDMIDKQLGGYQKFRDAFIDAAITQFGSGWAWLVMENNTLKIVKTGNADTPLAHGQKCLLTIDVWEHAYYLDFQNRRPDYANMFLDKLVNWDFVTSNL